MKTVLTTDQEWQARRTAVALGRAARVSREARGLSQADVAKQLGLDAAVVRKFEYGTWPNVKLGTIVRMLSHYNLSIHVASNGDARRTA